MSPHGRLTNLKVGIFERVDQRIGYQARREILFDLVGIRNDRRLNLHGRDVEQYRSTLRAGGQHEAENQNADGSGTNAHRPLSSGFDKYAVLRGKRGWSRTRFSLYRTHLDGSRGAGVESSA